MWRGWLVFEGRIARKVYWLHYALPIAVINIGALVVDQLIEANGIIAALASLLTILPGLFGSIKRLHDRNRSGWFLLIEFVPLIGAIWLLIETGFLRGTIGPNRFGADPLDGM